MPPLSPIEKRFLTLYEEGKSYKEICAMLGISLSTAKTHSRRILVKTMATCLRHAAYKRRKEESEKQSSATSQAPLNQARLAPAVFSVLNLARAV